MLALLALWTCAAARAQEAPEASVPAQTLGVPQVGASPLYGVVWEAPASTDAAASDLAAMRDLGVRAVRTGLVETPGVLTAADTLGIALFQEVDARLLPAERLAERLPEIRARLEEALERSHLHPSARAFGLAQQSDTSDPETCAALAQLANLVRERIPEARVYYTTRFLEADVCAGVADFVLLETLEEPNPAARLALWHGAHETPAGLAALGVGVLGGARYGRDVPGSPQAQARYAETHLATLRALDPAPVAVFLHRWRDAPGEARGYGLYDQGGEARPLREVVGGFYRGRQTVFAFETGRAPLDPVPWGTVFGWGLVLAFGFLYASAPRFRQALPRYFRAHSFYRDTLASGRGVLGGATLTLVLLQAMATGLLAALVLRGLYPTDAFEVALRLGPGVGGVNPETARLAPWIAGVFGGFLYALGVVFWASVLGFISRKGRPLHSGQLLMLIAWPRWTFGLVLLGVMVASVAPPERSLEIALVLGGAWFACYALASLRTLVDFANVSRAPLGYVILAGFVSPAAILGVVVLGALTLLYEPEMDFLQNLLLNS
jgi:hypothetical protein